MPFNIRKDARKWFSELKRNGFDIDFDAYYFCFMAGIAENRKSNEKGSDVAELVDYFPGRFSEKGKLMVALFLSQELKTRGINMNEKRVINSEVSKLVKPESPSYLSDVGMAEFNKYANGGYEVLLDWFDHKPQDLATFLRTFKSKLDDNLSIESRASLN